MRSAPWVAWLLGTIVLAVPASTLLAGTPASAVTASPALRAAGRSGPAALVAAAVHAAPVVTEVTAKAQSKRGLAAPAMSVTMALANSRKQAEARSLLSVLARRIGPDTTCTSAACRAGLPAARNLAATQQPQLLGYYCGPATASEMLAQLGVRLSQAAAARELGTTASGTNWSDASGYPMPRVLNANQARNQYVAVALPWAPSARQIRTFETDLVTDVNHNGGAPLAGNAYEVAGGPHLVGNPVNQTIMHWIDIRGYQDYGAVTDYEDSVHNATSIGWGLSVPAYSSLATSTMTDILGARGYDW
jgi:hypothetical protein